jgi:hypothetical protein
MALSTLDDSRYENFAKDAQPGEVFLTNTTLSATDFQRALRNQWKTLRMGTAYDINGGRIHGLKSIFVNAEEVRDRAEAEPDPDVQKNIRTLLLRAGLFP